MPEFIFAVDWASLELSRCPDFLTLMDLVRHKAIAAIGVFDRDRLAAEGIDRLAFLSECREIGVEVVVCQGPAFIDAEEGQLVELALSIGKKRQVLRARQGARDGLHDKVTMKMLPAFRHRVYGYDWDNDKRLVANGDYDTLCLVFKLIEQHGYDKTIKELHKRGILSPNGKQLWNKSTLSLLVHNPVYQGDYAALRTTVKEPIKRRANTYGNSSRLRLSEDQWHYLPKVEVVNAPLTRERRATLLHIIEQRQKLSARNARRSYLLRGFIKCGEHFGQNGEPTTFHGQPHKGSYRYVCPVGGCYRPTLCGEDLERFVKIEMGALISGKRLETSRLNELFKGLYNDMMQEPMRETLHKELEKVQRDLQKNIDAEVRLEERILFNKVSTEVAERLKEKLTRQRKWFERERDDKLAQLRALDYKQAARKSMDVLKAELHDRLRGDKLTDDEWRRIFETLNVRIKVRSREAIENTIRNRLVYMIERSKKLKNDQTLPAHSEERLFADDDSVAYLEEQLKPYNERKVVPLDNLNTLVSLVDVEVELAVPISQETLKETVWIALDLAKPN